MNGVQASYLITSMLYKDEYMIQGFLESETIFRLSFLEIQSEGIHFAL